eukprot:scaffold161478_cov13-Tisochrysis_lutea.AAC.1
MAYTFCTLFSSHMHALLVSLDNNLLHLLCGRALQIAGSAVNPATPTKGGGQQQRGDNKAAVACAPCNDHGASNVCTPCNDEPTSN